MPPTGDQPSGETFGGRIKRLRRAHDLTQRVLAADLGIDFTYLSKLENDRSESPGEDTVRKLAAALATDEEELLALAGKVPAELRTRAQSDVEFARLLRRLPDLSEQDVRAISKRLKISDSKQ